MTREKFVRWAKPLLSPAPLPARQAFLRGAGLAGILKSRSPASGHSIESSFNSGDGLGLLKTIHLFKFRDTRGMGAASCADFVRHGRILGFVRCLNSAFRCGFDARVLSTVLAAPLIGGRDEQGMGFAFDLESPGGSFSKITLYVTNPAEAGKGAVLERALGLKSGKAAAAGWDRLEELGVDFFPDGGVELKLYRRYGDWFFPTGALVPWQKAQAALLKRHGLRGPLLKECYGGSGRVKSRDLYWGGLDRSIFSILPWNRAHAGFLRLIQPLVRNMEIRLFALKRGKLEVYFR